MRAGAEPGHSAVAPRQEARPASPALAPFIASIGYHQGRFAHARERTLATGGTQLLVNLAADELWWQPDGALQAQRTPGAALQGADSRSGIVDPVHQSAIVWVAFRPGGAYPFFQVPASAVRDRLVGLGELWGRDGATLRERLQAAPTPAGKLDVVEAVLLARAARPLAPDPVVRVAAAALHRGATVAEVADRLGWPRQRLTRHFTDRVGLTPKRFARVRRFQRLLAAVTAEGRYGREADWARLAVDAGYHDQAHMIHDFRAFAGLCPTAYLPRSAGERNHALLPPPGGDPRLP